jgi:hypothetical protein
LNRGLPRGDFRESVEAMGPATRASALFLFLLLALPASADLVCWKPQGWVYRARYWVEISRGELLYGIGDEEQLREIRFNRRVAARDDGSFETPETDAIDARFARATNGRWTLDIRERGDARAKFLSAGYRCATPTGR